MVQPPLASPSDTSARRPTAGRIALGIAVVAVVAGLAAAVLTVGSLQQDPFGGMPTPAQDLTSLIAMIAGACALALGGFATATRRGSRPAVIAMIAGVAAMCAPILATVAFYLWALVANVAVGLFAVVTG